MLDILYLGVNMGNSGYRFFKRYPQAEEDYYEGFKWLIKLSDKYKDLDIAIKHHPGDYRKEKDRKELVITQNTRLRYIDNQMDSYNLANKAKLCVSYCSTMILELNGYYNLSRYIWNERHHRVSLKKPCKRKIERKIVPLKPSFFLDPYHRNRHFCRYIDDVNKHNCNWCNGSPLEIYEPYRLCSYQEFEKKALKCI